MSDQDPDESYNLNDIELIHQDHNDHINNNNCNCFSTSLVYKLFAAVLFVGAGFIYLIKGHEAHQLFSFQFHSRSILEGRPGTDDAAHEAIVGTSKDAVHRGGPHRFVTAGIKETKYSLNPKKLWKHKGISRTETSPVQIERAIYIRAPIKKPCASQPTDINIAKMHETKWSHYRALNPAGPDRYVYRAISKERHEMSLGLLPEAQSNDGSNAYFTGWKFARVALSATDAIKKRADQLINPGSEQETLVLRINVAAYNQWALGSDWPQLNIYQLGGGFHIAPMIKQDCSGKGKITQDWQIPPYFIEMIDMKDTIIKTAVHHIKTSKILDKNTQWQAIVSQYAQSRDTQKDCGDHCENPESMYCRWCERQADFLGGIVF